MTISPQLLLFIILVNVLLVNGIDNRCCPGENILFISNKSCSGSSDNNMVHMDCPSIVLLNDTMLYSNGFSILDDGTMMTDTITELKYCHSRQGGYLDESIYLICINPEEGDAIHPIQTRLMIFSDFFVVLTIIIYFMIPKLLDLQGICMIHALFGLAFGYIFLSIIQLNTNLEQNYCILFGYLTYFSFIYLFIWLAVLSFHIWRTTVKLNVLTGLKWGVAYHLFAIGGAAFLLLLTFFAQYHPSSFWYNIRPGIGEGSCWFKSSREIWVFFYGPILILLTLNASFYIWTIVSLWKVPENTKNKVIKYRLKLCSKLCILMGLTWIIEIITFVIKSFSQNTKLMNVLIFLMDLSNMLQGVLIFLVLVVFRKRVRRALSMKNICNIRFPSSWKNLQDEEMESAEEKVNRTIVEFNKSENNVVIDSK